MPKDPRIDRPQGDGGHENQNQNQVLSTMTYTKDLPSSTRNAELMRPGPSGIKTLVPGPSGMRPVDQELMRRLKWTTGGDHPPPGGGSLTVKGFIAVPEMTCLLCCIKPRDACLIHGNVSHQLCCYNCAKKLFNKKGSRCPICRRRIEKITRNIIP